MTHPSRARRVRLTLTPLVGDPIVSHAASVAYLPATVAEALRFHRFTAGDASPPISLTAEDAAGQTTHMLVDVTDDPSWPDRVAGQLLSAIAKSRAA